MAALATCGREISDSDVSEIKRLGDLLAEVKQERDEARMFAEGALSNVDALKAEVVALRKDRERIRSVRDAIDAMMDEKGVAS